MVVQIRVVDSDLREPVRLKTGVTEADRSAHQVQRQLSIFVACYALLHKLLIPLALRATLLRSSPYAVVDPWAALVLLWLFWLIRGRGRREFGLLLAAAFVLHTGIESYRAIFGAPLPGWLTLSHMISSWPLGLLGAWSLSRASWKAPTWGIASGAVTLTAFACITTVLQSLKPTLSASTTSPTVVANPKERPATPPDFASQCGAQTLVVDRVVLATGETVSFSANCGLSPAVLGPPTDGRLRLRNEGAHPINFHFYEHKAKGFGHGWNVLVGPHSERQSPPLTLGAGEVGILYSDTNAHAGLTAIVGPQSFGIDSMAWYFSRMPLKVERHP